MTTRQVQMPDLGEGLTEATVVRWLVDVGDMIAEDQAVAEVETAKATVELPTPFGGTITDLHAVEGEAVQVGAAVFSVDVGDDGLTPSTASSARSETAGAARNGAGPDDGSAAVDDNRGEEASGSVLVGYGTGRGRRRRRRADADTPAAPTTRPRAKPPVRRLAKDLGVDLTQIRGSGAEGRITRDDVHAAAQAATRPPTPPTATAPAGRARRQPVTGVRATIADHLTTAWREIPAASCWVDVDATALVALRDELVADHPDVRVTPLAVVLRACAVALRRVPQLNSSFDARAREIVYHDRVDLGVATHTDRGLLVPVVRDAAQRSILDLAVEVQRLATAARTGRLAPAELVGSTFSVSNFGAFGLDGGQPIVNHPEAGILGVGRIARRPWVVDDQVVPRSVATLSLAFDHRVCDGAEASAFLRLLADLVERPTRLLAY